MTKQELIDKHRDINTDYDWWDCIEDDLKHDLKEHGFEMDKMYFSGFWSQGDGACFTGYMRDWTAYVDGNPEFAKAFPGFVEYIITEGAPYVIKHTGWYSHSSSVSHALDTEINYWIAEYELREWQGEVSIDHHMRLALYQKAADELSDVDTWLREDFTGRMDALYRTLEQEYEYLTSDEAVWETIVANELDSELNEEDEDEIQTTAEVRQAA